MAMRPSSGSPSDPGAAQDPAEAARYAAAKARVDMAEVERLLTQGLYREALAKAQALSAAARGTEASEAAQDLYIKVSTRSAGVARRKLEQAREVAQEGKPELALELLKEAPADGDAALKREVEAFAAELRRLAPAPTP
jgi:hypothetical protein